MSPYFKMNFFKRASKGFYGYRPTSSLVTWLGTSITLLIVGGVLTLLRWDWFAVSWDWLSGDESNSATIRNIGLVIAGLIALLLAIWRAKVADRQASAAERQVGTAQEGLLNERYQKGAEMLGSPVLAVRMGGIYALQQLAQDHYAYHIQIMDLFCAFARRPPHDPENVPGMPSASRPRQDVQAIMDAVAARSESRRALERESGFALDLRSSDLSWVQMDSGFHVDGRVLSPLVVLLSGLASSSLEISGVDLSNARLDGANLQHADLEGANLSRAHLLRADLSDARLERAIMTEAIGFRTILSRARLRGADLSSALLARADLSGADFYGADTSDEPMPVTGLTQQMLDRNEADANNPPKLGGVVLDAETGKPLIWNGGIVPESP